MLNYFEIEKKSRKNGFALSTIDGKCVGCNKCYGYCMYKEHKGFLTERNIRDHMCKEKECHYFVAKQKEKRQMNNCFTQVFVKMLSVTDTIKETAQKIIMDYEGLKVRDVKLQEDGIYCISYVSITNAYDMKAIADRIKEMCPYPIRLVKLSYSFENACALFCQ